MEICSDVWDGHDYIPRVFDDWLADAGAAFQAAGVSRGAAFGELTALASTLPLPGYATCVSSAPATRPVRLT